MDMRRWDVEADEKWREIAGEIPFIKFPADWTVAVIPPFAGALARFRVKLPDGREKSIYLDFYDRLGYVGQPYWEIYPVLGDVERCLLNETDKLLAAIAAPDTES